MYLEFTEGRPVPITVGVFPTRLSMMSPPATTLPSRGRDLSLTQVRLRTKWLPLSSEVVTHIWNGAPSSLLKVTHQAEVDYSPWNCGTSDRQGQPSPIRCGPKLCLHQRCWI